MGIEHGSAVSHRLPSPPQVISAMPVISAMTVCHNCILNRSLSISSTGGPRSSRPHNHRHAPVHLNRRPDLSQQVLPCNARDRDPGLPVSVASVRCVDIAAKCVWRTTGRELAFF